MQNTAKQNYVGSITRMSIHGACMTGVVHIDACVILSSLWFISVAGKQYCLCYVLCVDDRESSEAGILSTEFSSSIMVLSVIF